MSTSIEQWAIQRKNAILSTLVSPSSSTSYPTCGTFDVPFELTLAKNVYTAEGRPDTALFAAEIFAHRHHDSEDRPSSFSALNIPRLNPAAQCTILTLLERCGLDGATTTTQELDHLRTFFDCETCKGPQARESSDQIDRLHSGFRVDRTLEAGCMSPETSTVRRLLTAFFS